MIKEIIGMTAGWGAGQIVNNIVTKTTPDNINKVQKTLTIVGSAVVGMMVSEKATQYCEEKYDEFINIFKRDEIQSE